MAAAVNMPNTINIIIDSAFFTLSSDVKFTLSKLSVLKAPDLTPIAVADPANNNENKITQNPKLVKLIKIGKTYIIKRKYIPILITASFIVTIPTMYK